MNRKEFVLNAVSRKQDLVVEVSDRIFDFAETGFHEFETAKLYQQVLEKEGFAVEMGIAGMPTAFKATYGNGKPVVAFWPSTTRFRSFPRWAAAQRESQSAGKIPTAMAAATTF